VEKDGTNLVCEPHVARTFRNSLCHANVISIFEEEYQSIHRLTAEESARPKFQYSRKGDYGSMSSSALSKSRTS
jgi:hypothetical protein